VFDFTWIASATPERLVVMQKAGRLLTIILFLGGCVFAWFAVTETDDTRWLAAIMATVDLAMLWVHSFVTTVTFDRPKNAVIRAERRPFWTDWSATTLDEVTGVEKRGRAGKNRIVLLTRTGAFFPIEGSVSPYDKTEFIACIEAWLGGDARRAAAAVA